MGAGKLNLLAGTAYTWHDLGTECYATVSKSSQKFQADYGANTTHLFTELGHAIPVSERATVQAFAGLAWSDLRTHGFSESGGSAALAELGAEVAITRNASLGLNYSGQYAGRNREHAGSVNLRWQY